MAQSLLALCQWESRGQSTLGTAIVCTYMLYLILHSDDFCSLTNTDRVIRNAPLFLEIALKFEELLLVAPESKQTVTIEAMLNLNDRHIRLVHSLKCEDIHALLKAMSSGANLQKQVAVQLHESGKFHAVEAWIEPYTLIRLEVILTDKDKNMVCIKIKEVLLFRPIE